ncbi:hypothetical protein [Gordonia crocea]|uniref:Uncharacterized protein n=1 Tax=Gordonia crocea TaxID=589162 RepID=A0A7I9UZM7_9ACTN|nr:hypothetical protein [Gordonia crocea]GED98575.1 hypothetical protein nbrc107697_26140 [Gordonia crocea]
MTLPSITTLSGTDQQAPSDATGASASRSGLRLGPNSAVVLIAALLAVVVPLLIWWNVTVPGRALIVCLFVLMVPGTPAAILLTTRARLQFSLAPALSLSSYIALTMLTMTVGLWWPRTVVTILAVVGLALTGPALDASRTVVARRRNRALSQANDRGISIRGRTLGRLQFRLCAMLTLAACLGLWLRSTAVVDLDSVSTAGLISALNWQYFAALAGIVIVAVIALRRPRLDVIVLAASAVCLIAVITLYVGIADWSAPLSTGYVHVGFIDAIANAGHSLTGIDARFSWPGFFATAASLTTVAGMTDATGFLIPFPLVAGTLLIAPVFTVANAITTSVRLSWLAVFIFIAGNWVQQDYFSPQAVAFYFYLTVIAVVMDTARRSTIPRAHGRGWPRFASPTVRTPSRAGSDSASATIAMESALLLVGAAMVVSHQLTPAALIVSLALLSFLGVTRFRTLWLGVGIVFAAWFAFGATDWWLGHLTDLFNSFGDASGSLQSGVGSRVRGDPEYQRMQQFRILWSAALCLLAAIGWLRLRHTRLAPATAALIAGTVSLVVGQSYGGEVVLRIFLYALPFLAACAAVTIGGLARRPGTMATIGVTVLMSALMISGTAARGVNTSFERTPGDARAAADFVLAKAPTGSTVRPLLTEGTLRARRITELRGPTQSACRRTAFECLLAQHPDYIVLTSTRESFEHLINGAIPDYFGHVETQLLTSGMYRVTWRSPNATVLERTSPRLTLAPEGGR